MFSTHFGRTDDWRNSDGEIIPAPTTEADSLFSTAYSYCVENWCIGDASDSLFTYGSSESFVEINRCGVSFSSEVEDAVLNIVENPSVNQELSDACDYSLVCLVDGVCGSITDAVEALENQQVIVEQQVEVLANIFPIEQVDIVDIIVVTDAENNNGPTTSTNEAHAKTNTPDRFWYPAWESGSSESICLNDGNASPYMKATGELLYISICAVPPMRP